jgi:hypothetical protein
MYLKRAALLFALLQVIFITLACQLETTRSSKPAGKKQSDIRFTLFGSVTDTWSWGQDSYRCDTQDEMILTINYANGVVLTLHGACYWPSSAFESCTEQQGSLPCGLVIYGTYSDVAE